MILNIFKPKRQRGGKTVSSRMYRGRYRLDGETQITDVPLHTNDKQVARQKLEEIVREQERERQGIIASKQQREAAQRPLSGHIADFIADRNAVGRDARYVRQREKKLLLLVAACRWNTAKDVTANSFQTWRSQQRITAKTLNEYLNAATGLMNWMERNELIPGNPLKSVQKAQSGGLQSRLRRAFTADELKRLMGVAGPRKPIYLMAVFTGLRREELRQLEWGDVHLDCEQPFINVRASTTKNHKQAVIPLHSDVVTALRGLRPNDADPGTRIFAGMLPRMKRFCKDLKEAKIEYLNAKSEYADFHALRKTFATNLTLAGTTQRVTMELMRHSDMRLTAKTYTDAGLLPIGDAVLNLPSIAGSALEKASQIGSQNLVRASLLLSSPVTKSEGSNIAETRMNTGFGHDLTPLVNAGPETENGARYRVRTCDFLRVKQALYH